MYALIIKGFWWRKLKLNNMIEGYEYSREQLELIIHNKRVYGLKVEQELIDKLNELKNKENE
jgi:ribosomal protein S10